MAKMTLKQQQELIKKQQEELARLKAMTSNNVAGKFGVYESKKGNKFLKVDIGAGRPILLTKQSSENLKELIDMIPEALDMYQID
jgi:hypothetical protein